MRTARVDRRHRTGVAIFALCACVALRPASAQANDRDNPAYERVDRPARLRPGIRAPVFPELLRGAKIEGEVVAQFIVDTLGRVESGSSRVRKSTHELFTDAVRACLPTLRFTPAILSGHRVRQLVIGAFEFPPGRAGGTWR